MDNETNQEPFGLVDDPSEKRQSSRPANHVGTTKFIVPDRKKDMKKYGIAILIILLLGVLGFFGYSLLQGRSPSEISQTLDDHLGSQPDRKTEMNPLTGIMYTPEEAAAWKDARPIGVMINNYIDARPQWGISKADLTYEIVAEGGITRYLAFFLTDLPEKIGPVRSIREYYLVLVKELGDAMVMHIGWSPQALDAIQQWPVRSLARGGATFERDQARLDHGIAIEHTAYVNGPYLRELGEELGWEGERNFDTYKFKDDDPILARVETDDSCSVAAGLCDMITIDFWYSGDYTAMFEYQPETNDYIKFTGYDENGDPIPTIDASNNDEQVRIKNLIVQFVLESPIIGDDKARLEYDLIGSGEGIVFMDGTAIPMIWSKTDRDSRTIFYDNDGNEIEFDRGKFWISIVPDRNVEQVTY